MKKSLLILSSCALASISFGQLTQANEPALGSTASMFLCDSSLNNLAGVVGTGVTWDYSEMAVYQGETRGIGVVDATMTAASADYPNCTAAFQIEGLISTYYYSTATQKISEGFIFTDAGTDYLIKWSTNPEILLTYPFAQGNNSADTYSGFVNALNMDLPASGSVNSTIDGTGTMLFPQGVSVPNVIRLKTIDVATASTILGDVEITREQYEYYDLATQSLPIFIHTKIDLDLPGIGGQANQLVLSKYGSTFYNVGINEGTIANLSVYPNPATDEFKINGNFSAGKVKVFTAQGQEVLTQDVVNGQSINVSGLTKGLYIVKVEANGSTSVKSLSVK